MFFFETQCSRHFGTFVGQASSGVFRKCEKGRRCRPTCNKNSFTYVKPSLLPFSPFVIFSLSKGAGANTKMHGNIDRAQKLMTLTNIYYSLHFWHVCQHAACCCRNIFSSLHNHIMLTMTATSCLNSRDFSSLISRDLARTARVSSRRRPHTSQRRHRRPLQRAVQWSALWSA